MHDNFILYFLRLFFYRDISTYLCSLQSNHFLTRMIFVVIKLVHFGDIFIYSIHLNKLMNLSSIL